MIQFTLKQNKKFALIEFDLQEDSIRPELLKTLHPPDMVKENFAHKGVVLSGRGPVWLYGFLVHYYHPTRMIAVYDPRLQGAVVISVHHPDYQTGMVIRQEEWLT